MAFRARLAVAAAIVLAAPLHVWGTSNLNLSKSNLYRLTFPVDLVSKEQAAAMLAELDRMGTADEATLRKWLPANFKRFGVAAERVKKLIVLPPGKAGPQTAIILLTDPADESRAVASTVKSSKSNSSD
jgi:hypothetical protein